MYKMQLNKACRWWSSTFSLQVPREATLVQRVVLLGSSAMIRYSGSQTAVYYIPFMSKVRNQNPMQLNKTKYSFNE